MARRRMEINYRVNTLRENKMVLCELASRGKIEQKNYREISKVFHKLNWKNAAKQKNGKNSGVNRLDRIPSDHPYGPIEGFPPGSWWGIRMDCSRDRVHKPFNAVIQDGPAGAVSLCTSHLNSNNDEDLGDSLTFTGGIYEPDVTANEPLLRSYQTQVPLRLVRSYNLTNDYAPKTGYRYDGLYTVGSHWIGVTSDTEKHHKFALVRVRDQETSTSHESCPKKPQTRCNSDRFSTNLDADKSSVRETENPRSRLEIGKFSNKSTEKIVLEGKKTTQDSTIVTRCISVKKSGEYPASSGMICVPYSESPVHNINRMLENSSKSTPCKLQNTNISIRTDLYDSSHNIQHDVKKNVSTFCRNFGTARNSRVVVNHSHVGTLNLNSCGPCPRDGQQESLIQSRSGITKNLTTQSPSPESNRSVDRATPVEPKTRLETADTRIPEIRDYEKADERPEKENTPAKVRKEDDDEILCPVTRIDDRTIETPETDRDEACDEMLREQRTAFDSLSPDKMLKFIVKQKYHPTAKLLIGSVIGLATGESKILRTYDSLISRNNSWNNRKLRDKQNNSPSSLNVDKTMQSTSEKSIKDQRNVGKSVRRKRALKERILTMRLRTIRGTKSLLSSEKKKLTKNLENSSKRLRKSKDLEKSQQAFSKSTSPKSSDKSGKKRRSELANLTIDAKVGPIIRGPRNRRLRGKSHIFPKKRHDIDIPSCRGRNETRGKNASIELASKNLRKTRINRERFIEHKKRVKKTETTITEESTSRVGANKKKFGQQREPVSRDDSTEDIRLDPNVPEVRRIVKMVDASTQYSYTRETSTLINDESEQENPVKVEWIDLEDVKSEISELDTDEQLVELSSEGINLEESLDQGITKDVSMVRSRAEEPPIYERLSAFVPVNITDSDFRIARLRSIGFKPIEPIREIIAGNVTASSGEKEASERSVVDRIADAQYNKYTSEETTVVGYMDDQLYFQDIEEDVAIKDQKKSNSEKKDTKGKLRNKLSQARSKKLENLRETKNDNDNTGIVSMSIDDDSELPWHGWKKCVKNKQAHWIGW